MGGVADAGDEAHGKILFTVARGRSLSILEVLPPMNPPELGVTNFYGRLKSDSPQRRRASGRNRSLTRLKKPTKLASAIRWYPLHCLSPRPGRSFGHLADFKPPRPGLVEPTTLPGHKVDVRFHRTRSIL